LGNLEIVLRGVEAYAVMVINRASWKRDNPGRPVPLPMSTLFTNDRRVHLSLTSGSLWL
jgi:hypothetical protein